MSRTPSRRAARWAVHGILALSLVPLTACWNGAFQTNEIKKRGGDASRFELVIEAKRNDLEASHFLVDTATGDLWVLQPSGDRAGTWVRVTDGPADALDLQKRRQEKRDRKRREAEEAAEAA
jgi:hypothetical protein